MSKKDRNSIPFLELSLENLTSLNKESDLPIEKILNIWVNLTKSSSIVKNGKRLENISWRIVNRSLVTQNNSLKTELNISDFKTLIEVNLKANQQENLISKKLSQTKNSSNSLSKQKQNHQNSHNHQPKSTAHTNNHPKSTSLFTHNHNPKLQQKTAHKHQNSTETTHDINTDSDDSYFDSDSEDESSTRSNSNNIPHNHNQRSNNIQESKKLSKINSKERVKEKNIMNFKKQQEIEREKKIRDDNMELEDYQPEPKYAFGYIHKSPKKDQDIENENSNMIINGSGKPQLNRSTSVVRGFSPNKVSISCGNLPIASADVPNSNPNSNSAPLITSSESSYKIKDISSHKHDDKLSSKSSNASSERSEKLINTQQLKSPSISSSVSPRTKIEPTNRRRINVLTNLGMTSLTYKPKLTPSDSNDSNNSRNSASSRKNMFFIESSPSPAESDLIGSIDNNLFDKKFKQYNQNNERKRREKHIKVENVSAVVDNEVKVTTPESMDKSGETAKHKDSLFGNKIPTKHGSYSSSESISNESEWDSVSESDISEDEEEYESDHELMFGKKDENPPKPTIKRSLLSGLFLNEMNQQLQKHEESRKRSQTLKKIGGNNESASDLSSAHPNNIGPALRSHTISPVVQSRAQKPVLQRSSTIGFINNSDQDQNKIFKNENKSLVDLSSSNKKSVVGLSDINIMASINHTDAKESLHKQSSKFNLNNQNKSFTNSISSQLSNPNDSKRGSIHSLISKSALNLTTYFTGKRAGSSTASMNGSVGGSVNDNHERNFHSNEGASKKNALKHSRAPATASTLLPIALTTHMFLPNAHQKAKSKLTSVIEVDNSDEDRDFSAFEDTGSGDQSNKNSNNSSNSNSNSNVDSHPNSNGNSNPNSNPTSSHSSSKNLSNASIPRSINIRRGNSFMNNHLNGNQNLDTYTYYTSPADHANHTNNQIPTSNTASRVSGNGALSPKTTRRTMLASELSESLRISLLTDHRLGKMPIVGHVKNYNIVNVDGDNEQSKWEDDNMNYHAKGW